MAVLINHYVAKNKKALFILHLNTLASVCGSFKYGILIYYNNVNADCESWGVSTVITIFFSNYFLFFSLISVLLKKEKSLSPETVSKV